MKRSAIFLTVAAFIITTGIASADMTFRTNSPMYHPMFGTGIGSFSATHNVGAGVESAAAVQATSDEWEGKGKKSTVTVKENEPVGDKIVPASSLGGGDDYSYEKGNDGYIYGYATGGEQGVNETKTIYTDGIGRIHFFGKKNRIKD